MKSLEFLVIMLRKIISNHIDEAKSIKTIFLNEKIKLYSGVINVKRPGKIHLKYCSEPNF